MSTHIELKIIYAFTWLYFLSDKLDDGNQQPNTRLQYNTFCLQNKPFGAV